MSEPPRIRAVQYLRMSTEHQRYSLRAQAEAIAEYAERHGYELTRTYFDPGKSGLTLKERKGLQSLLAEALGRDRDFEAILVLDVSRWGRFQDADQPAHYEFLCREAGASIVYCHEPFVNDGSPTSTLVKQIKRVMAAEFSRELSEKVRLAHRSHAQLGHHQGGPIPYGFRRVAVSASGVLRGVLEPGHWKSVATDHVVLVPGPPEELKVLKWIFRRYVVCHDTAGGIARRLNVRSVPTQLGGRWTYARVQRVLKNELAIGIYAFGRSRMHLRGKLEFTDPASWLRIKVFEPIVSPRQFALAQERLRRQKRGHINDQMLLDGLRRMLRKRGSLSERLINECRDIPDSRTYRAHFGTLPAAYALIGYQVEPPPIRRSDEEMLALLRGAHAKHGYVSARVIQGETDLPHVSRYRYRFGSLTRAYALAGLPEDQGDQMRLAHLRAHGALSNEELLAGLRRLWERDGFVCRRTVDADPSLPNHDTYYYRFGSWLKSLELAGLPAELGAYLSTAARRRSKIGGG